MSKVIEIPVGEFTKLIDKIDYYKDKIKDLESVVEFLNNQIDDYNVQFTSMENNADDKK